MKYIGYILAHEGIQLQSEKVQAIVMLKEPTSVKELCPFCGRVRYYCDICEIKGSYCIAPLTDLLGECGYTNVTKRKGIVNKKWYWD